MSRKSAKPWIRYSTQNGSILEVSMQAKPVVSPEEGLLFVDIETAANLMSGNISMIEHVVNLEELNIVNKASIKYIRTSWQLEDITVGTDQVEILDIEADGITLRRKDSKPYDMLVFVTAEQNPSALLSRHVLSKSNSPQKLSFDTSTQHSMFARFSC